MQQGNQNSRSVDNDHYYSFKVNMTDDFGPAGQRRQLMHGWFRTKRPTKVLNVPYREQAHIILGSSTFAGYSTTIRAGRTLQHLGHAGFGDRVITVGARLYRRFRIHSVLVQTGSQLHV